MVPPGPRGDDPYEGGAAPDDWPPAPRPYPTRPYPTRPYPTRAYGALGPEPRPYPTRPYPTRPYPTRPYPTRPYPTRPDAGAPPAGADARLDADEWTADVSELFIARSAVIGLGARLLASEGLIPVPQVTGAGAGLKLPDYLKRPEITLPEDKKPKLLESEAKPHGRVALRMLWPGQHELAWKVILPDDLAHRLAEQPEPAWAVKDDVARALALRADTAFLRGGPDLFPGINGVIGAPAGAAPAHDQARAMLAGVRATAGVVFDYAGWIFSTETLEQLAVAAQGNRSWDSTFLLTPDGADGGLLLGYPFITSEAAGDRIYFSADWSEAWIGVERRVVTVNVSTDAQFQSDETVIRAVAHHDLVIRRPELFAVGLL